MFDEILENIKIIRIANAKTMKDVLRKLANALISEKWAKRGLVKAVIRREKKYPTGLHTLTMGIALPHADPKWAIKPAMVVGILDEPVEFKPMDGVSENVEVYLIFMLCIPADQPHISFLRALTKLFSFEDSLEKIHTNGDRETLVKLLAEASKNIDQ
jgi:PTS system galactitol-specific IIA component